MKKGLIGFVLVMVSVLFVFAAVSTVAGNWTITMQSPRGERTNDMKITQDGEKIQVTITSQRGDQTYDGTIKGTDITWSGTRQTPDGNEFTVTYKGKVEGDTMKGTMEMGDRGSFDWSAQKAK